MVPDGLAGQTAVTDSIDIYGRPIQYQLPGDIGLRELLNGVELKLGEASRLMRKAQQKAAETAKATESVPVDTRSTHLEGLAGLVGSTEPDWLANRENLQREGWGLFTVVDGATDRWGRPTKRVTYVKREHRHGSVDPVRTEVWANLNWKQANAPHWELFEVRLL